MYNNNSQKVIIIGPAYPLRGGLASYDERLCREFNRQGHDGIIFTFSLQYPNFLFPGTTQYSTEPAPTDLNIEVCINSVNPLNWLKIGMRLKKMKPDVIVVRYWLPFMGPCLGTLLRLAKTNKHTRIICIADNIIPHEKRPGDKWFTRYFVKAIDAFITMSEKVLADLPIFVKNKPARFVAHPLYDNFGDAVDKVTARQQLSLPQNEMILLFFGFIRKYKGLDMLLQTMALLKNDKRFAAASQYKLLIAGEFYEDRKQYDELIAELNIDQQLILRTDFIPDSEVKNYLCAADVVMQPYRNATQSGVTPLAYHFEKPMIVTNVGGLPALVPHGKAGLVAEPNPEALAESILHYFEKGEAYFLPTLRQEKQKYSWMRMTDNILELAEEKKLPTK